MKHYNTLKGWGMIFAFLTLLSLLTGAIFPSIQMGNPIAFAQSTGNRIYIPLIPNKTPSDTVFGATLTINYNGGLSMMKAAGITWARLFVPWKDIEPNEGDRNWSGISNFEDQMKNAYLNNIRPIITIIKSPSWALKDPRYNCGAIKTEKMWAFASFMKDMVARYSQPPYNIQYWELWNEPDVTPGLSADIEFGCWGDWSDAYFGGGYYAEMLKVVSPAIKATNPNAQVLMGGLLLDCDPVNPPAGKDCTPTKFFEGVLRNGGGPYIDGVSFHSYEYYGGRLGLFGNTNWYSLSSTTGTSLLPKVAYLKSLLAKPEYNASGKYLIDTESAVVCTECAYNDDYETTKAYYIARTYADSLAAGVKGNLWYAVSGWRNSQLLTWNQTPLPAYYAYKFAYKELADATFIKSLDFGGVKGDEFKHNSKTLWLLWAMSGSQNVSLPTTPTAVYDVFGNPQTTTGTTFFVTIKPLYVEFGK